MMFKRSFVECHTKIHENAVKYTVYSLTHSPHNKPLSLNQWKRDTNTSHLKQLISMCVMLHHPDNLIGQIKHHLESPCSDAIH